jgi:hypothetical protein
MAVALTTYPAQSGLRKGDPAKYIEEAVRWRVLDQTASEVRERLGPAPANWTASIACADRSKEAPGARTLRARFRGCA